MILFVAKLILSVSVAALLYTYVGYPLLLWIVSSVRSKNVRRGDLEPTVSIIITAYNEERALAAKLENTLALDYPREKVEIIVASDCSSDRTDEIVRTFADRGVRLHRQPQRLGKTAAQNAAVVKARGEIIVFSDATSHYQSDVLPTMMQNFADQTVGCVAGRLLYIDPSESHVGRGARSYWGYETFLKKHESRASSLIGASGCLYAVRKSAYVPLYNEACSDFIIATKMVEQGLRAVYEPDAICTEETNCRSGNELRMRVRVIAQTYTDLWRHRHMLNPFRSGFYGVQLFSHKVMRYLVPFFLIGTFLASGLLSGESIFFRTVFVMQLGGYACAATAWLLERAGVRARLLALPQYFLLANVASLIALYKFLRGNRYAQWEPIREAPESSRLNPAVIK
jgi:cellulose synthase/poly-beta-1,6-N-acetylglucosamine synthase-like glycosyltransferase